MKVLLSLCLSIMILTAILVVWVQHVRNRRDLVTQPADVLVNHEMSLHTTGAAHGKGVSSAASNGDIESIRLYLARGGSINHRKPYGATLLYCAVGASDVELVKWLLAQRANPYAGREGIKTDYSEMTPRELAEQKKSEPGISMPVMDEIIEVLTLAEKEFEGREFRVRNCIAEGDESGVLTVLSEGGMRPEVYAEVFNYSLSATWKDVLMKLLSCEDYSPSLDLECIKKSRFSTGDKRKILEMVYRQFNRQTYAVFRDMLEDGTFCVGKGSANTPGTDDVPPGGGTLLMWAASIGNLDLVEYLLSIGADPKVVDEKGRTALQYVCTQPAAPNKEQIEVALRTAVGR